MRGTDEAVANQAEPECVAVSPEMTALLGCLLDAQAPMPPAPVAFVVEYGAGDAPPTLHVDAEPDLEVFQDSADSDYRQVFLVSREAVLRCGGAGLVEAGVGDFFLASELRLITSALRHPPTDPETRTPYRLAKCIELFCEIVRLFRAGQLVPLVNDSSLSQSDMSRIVVARQIIDERWNEKLTLNDIARACGVNRAKLTRGFREMFDCTVFEAMARKRLQQAGQLLLTTDLPVSSIGYESGYLNNASFTRAFGRHFGVSPTDYRAWGQAA